MESMTASLCPETAAATEESGGPLAPAWCEGFEGFDEAADLGAAPCTGMRFSRRSWLRATGLAGLAWLGPLSRRLALAEAAGGRPRSLIVLWLQGGASQLETFDPHPGSPTAYGSRAISTAVDGIQLGEGLEQTAAAMKDFSILRSVVGEEGDHSRATYNVKTGYRPFPGLAHPSIGAVLAHELPANSRTGEALEIPSHISILPSLAPGRGGYLGARYDAFQTGDPSRPVIGSRLRGTPERDERRRAALDLVESRFAAGRHPGLEEQRTLHRHTMARAEAMMRSAGLKAFDLEEVPAAERRAYGETPFGRGCLAALRLVERGVRCVEVTLNGWDSHVNNHETHLRLNGVFDPAFASLIAGLKARGLYEETVVLVGTEFGRTPRLNVAEGRDHWPHGFSVLLGGGGLRGGLALGETDPQGERTSSALRIRIEDIHATVLRALGVDPAAEITTPIGRPLPFSEGRVLRQLTG